MANAATQPVLAEELARSGVAVSRWPGLLALSPQPARQSAWALDVWTAPELLACASIGDAARQLRKRQRNWSLYAAASHFPGGACRFVEDRVGIDPGREDAVDWLFSDIIAYPARLLGLVTPWIDSAKAPRILCTIKFQGRTDHATAERFAAIEAARLLHLAQNKHELTFFWQRPLS